MICQWEQTGDGYRCVHCGATSDRRRMQACGHSDGTEAAYPQPAEETGRWLLCPRRGPSIATINARKAGCGCGSSRVEVYQCELFDEPVLKKAAARCLADIAELVPAYTGRTCRECDQADQAD